MTVTYTTVEKVASFIRTDVFDSDSTPTFLEVEELINDVEDIIDEETGNTWRTTTVTEEYHDYAGYTNRIIFNNTNILTFDSNLGDKLEIADYNGVNVWKNFLADFVEADTIGGSKDWYMDYKKGILYFQNKVPFAGKLKARLTYRHKKTPVPGNISKAAKLLVCADLAMTDRNLKIFPDAGEDTISLESLAEKWEKKAYGYLAKKKKLITDTMSQRTRRIW